MPFKTKLKIYRTFIVYTYFIFMAIKIIGIILTIAGAIGLVFGVLGIFGTPIISLNSWALAILGFIFFIAGIGMLKRVGNN